MDGLRRLMKDKPVLGWAVAAVAIAAAAYFAMSRGPRDQAYTPDMMRQIITIRFADTGDTIDIPRGTLLRDIARGGKVIDPTRGIVNPKTGQPTGFPFDKNEWEAMVARINKDMKAIQAKHPGMVPVVEQTPAEGGK